MKFVRTYEVISVIWSIYCIGLDLQQSQIWIFPSERNYFSCYHLIEVPWKLTKAIAGREGGYGGRGGWLSLVLSLPTIFSLYLCIFLLFFQFHLTLSFNIIITIWNFFVHYLLSLSHTFFVCVSLYLSFIFSLIWFFFFLFPIETLI